MPNLALIRTQLNSYLVSRSARSGVKNAKEPPMLRTVFLSLAVMTSIPLASAGHNQIESAEALVSTAAQDISQTENARVADAVLQHIDTRSIANFTLGHHC